jgi:hypothetical protein
MPLTSFSKRNCIIGKLNPRTENHGDEVVNACDIVLKGVPFDREDVDKLCGKYVAAALYTEEGRGNSKVYKPMLPMFGELRLIHVYYKSKAVIAFAMNDTKIELKKIKIKDVIFECQDGGTTMVSVKLQGYPTDKEMGMLYAHQGHQESVTIYFGSTVDEEAKPKADAKQQGLELGEGGARIGPDDDYDDEEEDEEKSTRSGGIGDQPATH